MTEPYRLLSDALSHPGRKRTNNEDFVTYFEPEDANDLKYSGCLYIVADGVGGSSFGERASQYASEKVLFEYYQHPEVEPGERLKNAMWKAGNEIFTFADESERQMRMATTMVACAVVGDQLIVANVGDSRAYLFRNGNLTQLTHDHSLVGEMIRNGEITEEEGMRSKIKNRITRSLGGEEDVKVDIFRKSLQPGDRILMCTDGITRYATPNDLRTILPNGFPENVTAALIDFANRHGGADNSSAIVIDYEPVKVASNRVSTDHGHTPRDLDWDTLKTEARGLKPSRMSRKRLSYDTQILIVGGLVIFLFAAFLSGLIYYSVSRMTPNPAPVEVSTLPVEVSTLPVEVFTPNNPVLDPTPEASLVPAVHAQPENALEGPIPTPSATANPLENSKVDAGVCIKLVEDGENISTITTKIQKNYPQLGTQEIKFSRYSTCHPIKELIFKYECELEKPIDDLNKIGNGEFLKIFELKKEFCHLENFFWAREKIQ